MSEWVKINPIDKKTFPFEHYQVLFAINEMYVEATGYLSFIDTFIRVGHWEYHYEEGKVLFCLDGLGDECEELNRNGIFVITHWMPLPEPPEPE